MTNNKRNYILKSRSIVTQISVEDLLTYERFSYCFTNCDSRNRYSILVRVNYKNSNLQNTNWKVLGTQLGLYYESKQELDNIVKSLQTVILQRLESALEIYDVKEEDITGVQLLIYKVNYTDIVSRKIDNLNELDTEKSFLTKLTKNELNKLPFYMTKTNFGEQMSWEKIDNSLYVTMIEEDEEITFDLFKRILNLGGSTHDMQISLETGDIEVYSIENHGHKYILCKYQYDDDVVRTDIYTPVGHLLCNYEDIISDGYITRNIGNLTIVFNDNGIIEKRVTTRFSSIEPITHNKRTIDDYKIGTLDLETYVDNDLSKVYAAGFYADKKCNTFYINEGLDSSKVVLDCLDAMLKEKYHKYTFYVHNMGKFDIVFLLKIIISANEKLEKDEQYKYNMIYRDDVIISMTISKKYKYKKSTDKVGMRSFSIKLVDSYNILNSSLDKLCKLYNTETKKTLFPYSFINKNTLFYKGSKPELTYFNSLDKNISIIDYNNIPKDWSTKDQTLSYLENDLISLFEVIETFKTNIYRNYHVHITDSLTISSLALNIFLSKYNKNKIPLVNKMSIYNDIKNSYFGGITEVYKPYCGKAYYYDVNSLYPYAALNDMPGLNCVLRNNINTDITNMHRSMFGFYYCKIKSSDDYIGLLPVRTKTGLLMPNGEFEGWYFSEELKFASNNGYKIEVIKGYEFNRESNVFNNYVKEFYNKKANSTNDIDRAVSKSLLNNLLGRFGLKVDKAKTVLVSQGRYLELIQYCPIRSVTQINDKYLVTYDTQISKEICETNKVDYNKTYNNIINSTADHIFSEGQYRDVSIVISSAVTSYARIFMCKVKLDILSKGGNIYYSDTDSIVTDIELSDDMVGKDIGQFKLEHNIKEGYFISSKTYAIKDFNDKTIIRAKGVNSNKLNWEDFISLYNQKKVVTQRRETERNYEAGSVNMNRYKNIELSPFSYNKRVKLFDKDIWVNTSPLILSKKYHTKIKPLLFNYIQYIMFSCIILLMIIQIYIYIDYNTNLEYIKFLPLTVDVNEINLPEDIIKTDLTDKTDSAIIKFYKKYLSWNNTTGIRFRNLNTYNNSLMISEIIEHKNPTIDYSKTIFYKLQELHIKRVHHENNILMFMLETRLENEDVQSLEYKDLERLGKSINTSTDRLNESKELLTNSPNSPTTPNTIYSPTFNRNNYVITHSQSNNTSRLGLGLRLATTTNWSLFSR